jgi:hypothetical protein
MDQLGGNGFLVRKNARSDFAPDNWQINLFASLLASMDITLFPTDCRASVLHDSLNLAFSRGEQAASQRYSNCDVSTSLHP